MPVHQRRNVAYMHFISTLTGMPVLYNNLLLTQDGTALSITRQPNHVKIHQCPTQSDHGVQNRGMWPGLDEFALGGPQQHDSSVVRSFEDVAGG
jgi:hypothetical protein